MRNPIRQNGGSIHEGYCYTQVVKSSAFRVFRDFQSNHATLVSISELSKLKEKVIKHYVDKMISEALELLVQIKSLL